MRIAICFNGQLRTAVHAAPAIKRWIGNVWKDCDFFIHTWDISSYYSVSELLAKFYTRLTGNKLILPPNNHISYLEKQLTLSEKDFIQKFYQPKVFDIECYSEWLSKHKNVASVRPSFRPPFYYSFNKGMKHIKKYEKDNSFKYDLVVRIRPDISYNLDHLPIYKDVMRMDSTHFVPNMQVSYLCNDVFKFLENSTHLYANDEVIWMGSSDVMYNFSNIWKNFDLHYTEYANKLNFKITELNTLLYTFHRYYSLSIPSDDWAAIHILQRAHDHPNFINEITLLEEDVKTRLTKYLRNSNFISMINTHRIV